MQNSEGSVDRHDFLEVRSDDESGKLLFSWNPDDNTVDIVKKDTLYRVKLVKQRTGGAYRILEKRPKQTKPKAKPFNWIM